MYVPEVLISVSGGKWVQGKISLGNDCTRETGLQITQVLRISTMLMCIENLEERWTPY